MTETIVIDLKDDMIEDNKRFFKLLDDRNWKELLQRVEEGEDVKVVLEEILNGD